MSAEGDGFVTCTHDEAMKLYRVRQTCVEMLEDRGYTVTESQKVASVEEFRAKFTVQQASQMRIHKENLRLYAERSIRPYEPGEEENMTEEERRLDMEEQQKNRSIMVFFVGDAKLSERHIRTYFHLLEKEERGCSRCIVVSPTLPTSLCKVAMQACDAAGKIFEHFLESELLINVRKHELVPEHIPLSEREKRSLLLSLKIKESQLPRLQLADPMARHYGLRKGNVVKIIRPSETAGEYVTYRLVHT
eukprot:Sspe_Gene.40507::Locus_19573_Transcript_1_1_Confidence_1.000_Length_1546::g.40507::m.40507/K03013/RPB5, POLR2E; DNA-directed RNA polymerases I, II, and III subunit RPABC1